MAHTGEVIYVDMTTTPHDGVSVYDVQQVLGLAVTDVGTLCSSRLINKWSKYKPVGTAVINTYGQIDESTMKWKASASWWRGNDGGCGITVLRTASSLASLKTAIDTQRITWDKTIPTGGVSEPYRLTDFNEYHHNALPPTFALGAGDAHLVAGSTLTIMVATSADDGYSLKFSDIATYDNWYYTVAVYDTSGGLKFVCSTDKKVSEYNAGESIIFEIPYNNGTYGYDGILTAGNTYYAYAFLSSVKYDFTRFEYVGTASYLPLPCGDGDYGMTSASFRCRRDSMWATVDAFANERIVEWTVYLYGAGSQVTGTIRLIDLQGNIVSGQSFTVDFSTGTPVTAGDGTQGYAVHSSARNTLLLPTNNPEAYLVEFIAPNISVRAGIGHDINPDT